MTQMMGRAAGGLALVVRSLGCAFLYLSISILSIFLCLSVCRGVVVDEFCLCRPV